MSSITQKISTFFKEVFVEMKRVSWLPKNEVFKYTIIVLVSTIVVAMFLGGLDYIFTTIIRSFILK